MTDQGRTTPEVTIEAAAGSEEIYIGFEQEADGEAYDPYQAQNGASWEDLHPEAVMDRYQPSPEDELPPSGYWAAALNEAAAALTPTQPCDVSFSAALESAAHDANVAAAGPETEAEAEF
jgi:hypothetical protein